MNVTIAFKISPSVLESLALYRLSNSIEENCNVSIKLYKDTGSTGLKNEALTIAISLAGLALGGISTFITVLSHWQSTQTKYSLSLKRGDITINIENMTEGQIRKVIQELSTDKSELDLAVLVNNDSEKKIPNSSQE